MDTLRLTFISWLKLLILLHPAFSRWKLAQRSNSSSGDSFIRSSSVSPSLNSAARAEKKEHSDIKSHSFNLDFALDDDVNPLI